MGYRKSWVFSTSDCNQDECDPHNLHCNAESLSTLTRNSSGSILFNWVIIVKDCFNNQQGSCRTPEPSFNNIIQTQKLHQLVCLQRFGNIKVPMCSDSCVSLFSLAIFVAVLVSNLIYRILNPLSADQRWTAAAAVATVKVEEAIEKEKGRVDQEYLIEKSKGPE